jgi:hypothetical protein
LSQPAPFKTPAVTFFRVSQAFAPFVIRSRGIFNRRLEISRLDTAISEKRANTQICVDAVSGQKLVQRGDEARGER